MSLPPTHQEIDVINGLMEEADDFGDSANAPEVGAVGSPYLLRQSREAEDREFVERIKTELRQSASREAEEPGDERAKLEAHIAVSLAARRGVAEYLDVAFSRAAAADDALPLLGSCTLMVRVCLCVYACVCLCFDVPTCSPLSLLPFAPVGSLSRLVPFLCMSI